MSQIFEPNGASASYASSRTLGNFSERLICAPLSIIFSIINVRLIIF